VIYRSGSGRSDILSDVFNGQGVKSNNVLHNWILVRNRGTLAGFEDVFFSSPGPECFMDRSYFLTV